MNCVDNLLETSKATSVLEIIETSVDSKSSQRKSLCVYERDKSPWFS